MFLSQVVRAGLYGGATLSGNTAALVIDEFTPSGAYVKNWTVPAGATNPCTISGSSTTEGYASVSPDGTAAVWACYNAAPGTTGRK